MLLTELKIIQQTNMTVYSKTISTRLTGINTILAVRQFLSQQPFCNVTALHMLANMCRSCDHNLRYSVTLSVYAAPIGYQHIDNVEMLGLQKEIYFI